MDESVDGVASDRLKVYLWTVADGLCKQMGLRGLVYLEDRENLFVAWLDCNRL